MKYYRKRIDKKEHGQKSEMGNCSEWSQWNGFYPNGLVGEEFASIAKPLDAGRWSKAEKRTAELISLIQPNRPSENHRNAVASYVQRLVSNCVPCQVFTFGSLPLKTYLPDGDIDLTAFCEDPNLKDSWAEIVQAMLLKEESNEHAEFPVKEVQLIQAEVRLIKCLVDNIVVDISFNQLGGLCTLCFLEEVDNLISQNHLFKRSIILIKAWCFYESRILGAHHGLISTYALETLVLYIFHVFNNSFSGPLEVLYRFLQFFSKFDWANFCVSLWGPVPISSLPRMAADPPQKDGGQLLLSKMFLDACGTAYSVFPVPGNRETHFISKHLNVVDPLRLNNNLGRSVNKGNFYRICSAFSLGARQLTKILECPVEEIVPELNQFFVNTLDRHALIHKDLSASKQKDYDELRSRIPSGVNHYSTERSKLWKKQHDDIKQTCMKNILQTRGHTTHHFARTSSSPELTNTSREASRNCRNNVASEKVNDSISSRPGYSRRKIDPITRENHAPNRFTNEPSVREGPSHHSIDILSEHSLSNCVSKAVSSSTTPVVSSVPEPRHRFEEEQHFGGKLSSSGIQDYGGHTQMPVNVGSYSFVPFTPSKVGYNQRNSSTVESDWGTGVNYSNGPFPVHFHQQVLPFGVVAEQEDMTGRINERVMSPGVDHPAEDSGFWIDHHTNGEIDHESNANEGNPTNLYPMNWSDSSTDLFNQQEHASHTDSNVSKDVITAGEHFYECDSDIFNSDFANHLKNLLYGRFCQDIQFRHSYVYPPSVLPMPLLDTSNIVSPGRPSNFDQAVPVSAHQPGSVSPVGVSRPYGGEVSKRRNGTGTYFPNPDIMKDRQCPNPRQYQEDYGESRRDKESNWNSNSNPRFGSRQPRKYYEKQNTKIDRSDTSTFQTDGTWDTFQKDSNPLCLSNYPPPSNSSQYVPDAVDYSVYQVDSVNSDKVSSAGDALQSLVMMCPYPAPENLQFGSLRPEHFMRIQVHKFNGFSKGGAREVKV